MLGDAVFTLMWGQRSKHQCETPPRSVYTVCVRSSAVGFSWVDGMPQGGRFIKVSPPHHTNPHICALDQCHCHLRYFRAKKATRIVHITSHHNTCTRYWNVWINGAFQRFCDTASKNVLVSSYSCIYIHAFISVCVNRGGVCQIPLESLSWSVSFSLLCVWFRLAPYPSLAQ